MGIREYRGTEKQWKTLSLFNSLTFHLLLTSINRFCFGFLLNYPHPFPTHFPTVCYFPDSLMAQMATKAQAKISSNPPIGVMMPTLIGVKTKR